MKIAIFSDCYLDLTGGITTVIDAQKAELERNGHTVYVFSTGFPRSKQQLQQLAKKNIYCVPSCRFFFRGLTPISRRPNVLIKWFLEKHPELENFDVFYIHYEAGCSIAGLKLAKKLKVPSMQMMHGREDMGETNIIPLGLRTLVAIGLNFLHARYIPHIKHIKRDHYLADKIAKAKMWEIMVNHANDADVVLTPSEHFRAKLRHYGVQKKIEVLPNGFRDDRFPVEAKAKHYAPDQELRIVWHSRVSAEKRMMPFLEALTRVDGKWKLDVFGGGGDYFRAQRFAKRHHLNVHFHGNVKFEKIQAVILKSHLDVLVSYNFDTFGMTLIEAEAACVPVFFCDPDMREIVPEGGYIMSKKQTPESMAQTLNQIFQHPEKINQMSLIMQKNRKNIMMSRRIKKLEKIINEVAN